MGTHTDCDPVRAGQESCPPFVGVKTVVVDDHWSLPFANARNVPDHLVRFVVAGTLRQREVKYGRNITHSQGLQLLLTDSR